MSKDIKSYHPPAIQLELFQTTKRLNLSERYESIPKGVSLTDPSIEWDGEYITKPVEKAFSIDEENFVAEITPALIKDKKSGKLKPLFPDFRESKIEYAIISLASKKLVDIDYDKENNQVHVLKTTYYQIQKEIVESINRREGKNLTPYDCPYNITNIKEALEILKKTTISVRNEKGEGQYMFNRIKDVYMNDRKVSIELSSMATKYINSGEWIATDKHSILASKGKYEMRLRVLLNLKFRYASMNTCYNPSLSFLINNLSFTEFAQKRTTLQRMTKIIESLHEVEKVEVKKVLSGRRIIDAHYTIYPSKEFITTMVENNKASKRTKEALMNNNGVPLIEPMETDFESKTEYHEAKRKYKVEKGKLLYE